MQKNEAIDYAVRSNPRLRELDRTSRDKQVQEGKKLKLKAQEGV
jgi:hypothetical protein